MKKNRIVPQTQSANGNGLHATAPQSGAETLRSGTACYVSELSQSDQTLLESFERKLQLVRDRVTAVALGYANGFILDGPGGVSKSYTVIRTLRELQTSYRLSNSRMTGRGLFDTLQKYPSCTHVVEDVEALLLDKMAVGVMRSALWGLRPEGNKGPQERWVTWTAFGKPEELLFSGGVILIGNRNLPDLLDVEALKTRVPCMRLQPGDDELRALMRKIALQPYEHDGHTMSPGECQRVCEYVIAECMSLHRPADLRLLINAFNDYLQFEAGDGGVHWVDAIAANIRNRPVSFREQVSFESRAGRKAKELEIAREIMQKGREERRQLWEQRTGKSEKALYRRLQELKLKFSDSQINEN